MPGDGWPDGPVVLGVGWKVRPCLVQTAADLAAALDRHLVCAFVDPASYLTEWEPNTGTLTALSIDPGTNEEAEFPSGQLQDRLKELLGTPGKQWSFRVLNGDVPSALTRLATSCNASLLIVGAGGKGSLAWVDRVLEGSVAGSLLRRQHLPVLIVPNGSVLSSRSG